MLAFLFISGCGNPSVDQIPEKTLEGTWDCIERNGMGFPVVYDGEAAQEAHNDSDLASAVQYLQMNIEQDSGILISYFEMTNLDGSTYDFEYPMPLIVEGADPSFKIIATDDDPEIGGTLTFNCTLTNAEILTCKYSDSMDNSNGTINFIRL